MTGGVQLGPGKQHPVVQLATDHANFSVNTDGPLMTGRWLREEFDFCQTSLGLSKEHLMRSTVNAAKAAFVDTEEERNALVEHVKRGL